VPACSDFPSQAPEKPAQTRFIEYNKKNGQAGAGREEYLLLLPGLKSIGRPEKSFVTAQKCGDTLKIIRNYYPANSGRIEVKFYSIPEDKLGILISQDDGIFINSDAIPIQPERPGINGGAGLRFDYKPSYIAPYDLSVIDTFKVFCQNNGVWQLATTLSRQGIIDAMKIYPRGRPDYEKPIPPIPFYIKINQESYTITIYEKELVVVKK